MPSCTSVPNFYPRPPRGGRPDEVTMKRAPAQISIHALREEGDQSSFDELFQRIISIHALREEGDEMLAEVVMGMEQFLSTPSARRATQHDFHVWRIHDISIHALREEGDPLLFGEAGHDNGFLSTPSARRATPDFQATFTAAGNFYPRPPRGGRRVPLAKYRSQLEFLSTPSARRATESYIQSPAVEEFLSTPSARRATPRSH